MIRFPHRIENSKQDAKLTQRLTHREVGSILYHASMQFMFYRMKYPGGSATFQNVINDIRRETGCDYFQRQQKSMMQGIQPMHMFLKQCISQGLKIVPCKNTEEAKQRCFAKNNYVTWQRFVSAFKRFMNKSVMITEELYSQPFKHVGLIRTSDPETREVWDADSMTMKPVTAIFVLGLRDMENRDDDDELVSDDDNENEEEEEVVEKTIEMVEKHLCDSNPAAFQRFISRHPGSYNKHAVRNMCELIVQRPDNLSEQDLFEIRRVLASTLEATQSILDAREGRVADSNKRQRSDE